MLKQEQLEIVFMPVISLEIVKVTHVPKHLHTGYVPVKQMTTV
jgi:hypothetical protein